MEPYQYSGANITVFRIVDSSSEKMEAFFQFQEEQAEDDNGGDNKGIEENVCVLEGEGKAHALITEGHQVARRTTNKTFSIFERIIEWHSGNTHGTYLRWYHDSGRGNKTTWR